MYFTKLIIFSFLMSQSFCNPFVTKLALRVFRRNGCKTLNPSRRDLVNSSTCVWAKPLKCQQSSWLAVRVWNPVDTSTQIDKCSRKNRPRMQTQAHMYFPSLMKVQKTTGLHLLDSRQNTNSSPDFFYIFISFFESYYLFLILRYTY